MPTKVPMELKEILFDADKREKLVILPYTQEDIESHNHQFFELVYITGGSAVHTLNEEVTELSEGDYFIVDVGSVHRYTESNKFTLINCLFLPEIIDEGLKDCLVFKELIHSCLIRYYKLHLGKSSANRIFHDESGEVLRLLTGILREYKKKEIGYEEIFRGKLLEIIILMLRSLTDCGQKYKNTTVQNMVAYVDVHYKTGHVLQGFCQEHHYAPQYISRRFKEETGFTVMEYLHKVRMEKSCEFLAGTDRKVVEIAQSVGYADMKFFYTVFKRMIKMSPREYRKISQYAGG